MENSIFYFYKNQFFSGLDGISLLGYRVISIIWMLQSEACIFAHWEAQRKRRIVSLLYTYSSIPLSLSKAREKSKVSNMNCSLASSNGSSRNVNIRNNLPSTDFPSNRMEINSCVDDWVERQKFVSNCIICTRCIFYSLICSVWRINYSLLQCGTLKLCVYQHLDR